MNYSSADWIAGTVVLLLTLLIPLVVRRWIVKKALPNSHAGFISAAIGVALFAFFYWAATLVGQQDAYMRKPHVGLVVIAFLSYWILTAKRKERADRQMQDKRSESADTILDIGQYSENDETAKGLPTKIPTKSIVPLVVGIGVGYVIAVGVESLTSPKSYDDCILESMPSSQTWQAAALIKSACRSKYVVEPKSREEISDPFGIVTPKTNADLMTPTDIEVPAKEPDEPMDESDDD